MTPTEKTAIDHAERVKRLLDSFHRAMGKADWESAATIADDIAKTTKSASLRDEMADLAKNLRKP
jgi:hypothetical protein